MRKVIPAFLVISPGNVTQGSSNGYGMYSEIEMHEEKPGAREILSTIIAFVHEYLHKAVNPRAWFSKIRFYKNICPEIYANSLSAFVDEIIIYYVSEVYLLKGNIRKNMGLAKLRKTKNVYFMWRGTLYIKDILSKYLEGKLGVQQTRIALDSVFRRYVKKLQKEIANT